MVEFVWIPSCIGVLVIAAIDAWCICSGVAKLCNTKSHELWLIDIAKTNAW